MLRPLALAAVVLAPLVVAVAGTTTGALEAADEPAWATAPTTSPLDTDTGTSTSVDPETDSSGAATGATTETMPPVYEPCGCDSAGEAGGWAALALLFTWGSPFRRRRPTNSRPCCPAA